MTEDQEIAVYKKMKVVCDEKLKPGASPEDDARLLGELKDIYAQTVTSVLTPGQEMPNLDMENAMQKLQHGMSDRLDDLTIGDIVKARAEGEEIFFEGVVLELLADPQHRTMVVVDFGEEEIETFPIANVVRVMPWTAIEIGDQVQAQPFDEENFYEAIIDRIYMDPDSCTLRFDVSYLDCEDKDTNMPEDRIRKVQSHRATREKFKQAVKRITIINAFKNLGFKPK